jgi:hypothetical protein
MATTEAIINFTTSNNHNNGNNISHHQLHHIQEFPGFSLSTTNQDKKGATIASGSHGFHQL